MKERVLLLVVFFLSVFHSVEAQQLNSSNDRVFIMTEPMPAFPGGDKALQKFIKDKLSYPQDALAADVEGVVTILFAISPSGNVVNAIVKDSLFHSCDSVALAMVNSMPKWIPVNGNRISDTFTLPVKFSLPYVRNENREKIYRTCEEVPSFPGGEIELYHYIVKNLKYPVVGNGEFPVQGRVVLRFVVTQEGKITNIEVLRSLDPYLDREAIRVVESMPDWIPAKHKGEKVKCYFTLPLIFRPR